MEPTDVLTDAALPTAKKRLVSADPCIRECTPADLDAVAVLFQRILRKGERCNVAALAAYLKGLFLEHPWRDPDLKSLVSVRANGTINGFIGVIPVRMIFSEVRIRAALSSSLMVDKPHEAPLAGVRLLASFVNGPQDLSLTDTANGVSQRMWKCFGCTVASEYSMDWMRILRPVEAGIALAERRSSLARPLHGAARMFDTLLRAGKRPPFRLERNGTRITQRDLDTSAAIDLIQLFAARYELRPSWSAGDLRWFLMHAARKELHGELTARSVLAANGTPIGCYLFYARPGGVASVLQIMSDPQHGDSVVKSLLGDVYDMGCAAVKGRTQPDLLEPLLQNGCIFKPGSWVTIRSRRPELLAPIGAGTAWITGLAGESWTRLIHGQFA